MKQNIFNSHVYLLFPRHKDQDIAGQMRIDNFFNLVSCSLSKVIPPRNFLFIKRDHREHFAGNNKSVFRINLVDIGSKFVSFNSCGGDDYSQRLNAELHPEMIDIFQET